MARSCLPLLLGAFGAVLASSPAIASSAAGAAAAQKRSLGRVQSPSLQPGGAQRLSSALGDAARATLSDARLTAGADAGLTVTFEVARFGENRVLTLRLVELKAGFAASSHDPIGSGAEVIPPLLALVGTVPVLCTASW